MAHLGRFLLLLVLTAALAAPATGTQAASPQATSPQATSPSASAIATSAVDPYVWEPEPTVARFNPLSLTLTFAVTMRESTGAPITGKRLQFSLFAKTPTLYDEKPKFSYPICVAVTDANGRATCGGKALVGSLLSVLGGGAYATALDGPFATDYYTKLPLTLG